MKKALNDGLYAGIDIGSFSIKAVILERKSGRSNVLQVIETLLSPQSDFPGESEYKEHLISKLVEIAEKLHLKSCKGISAIFHDKEIQVKFLELPSAPSPEQLEQMLFWEAKKLIPQNLKSEPFIFAYRSLKADLKNFALAAVPLSRFQAFLAIFDAAKIRPDALFPEAFTAISAKSLLPTATLPALSLINIGHFSTHIHIFSNGEPKFYRQIPSGTVELSEDSQDSEFEVFTQKIRFSFDYFRAVTKLGNIDEILIYGGGSLKKGLFDFAKRYFAPGRTAKLDFSSKFGLERLETAGLGVDIDLATYLPALIATFCYLENNGTDNLVDSYLKRLEKENYESISRYVPTVLATICTIILFVTIISWKNKLQEQLTQIKENIHFNEVAIAAAKAKLEKQVSAYDPFHGLSTKIKKTIEPLLRDRLSGSEIFYKIAQSKIDGIFLKQIQILPADYRIPDEPEPQTQPQSQTQVQTPYQFQPQQQPQPQSQTQTQYQFHQPQPQTQVQPRPSFLASGSLQTLSPELQAPIPVQTLKLEAQASAPLQIAKPELSTAIPIQSQVFEPAGLPIGPENVLEKSSEEEIQELPPVLDGETLFLKGSSVNEQVLLTYIGKILKGLSLKRVVEYKSTRKSGKIEFTFRGQLP
ncbi:MAG: pilus assembly protein PilM [Candidatus Riflebacteria bacterium]|nr:pilus assembly protein PilM [Candidatus Riflebacteria bacterium]